MNAGSIYAGMNKFGEAKGGSEKAVPRWLRTVAFVSGFTNVLGTLSYTDFGLGGVVEDEESEVAVGGDSVVDAFSEPSDFNPELASVVVVSGSVECSAEVSASVLVGLAGLALVSSSVGDLTSRSMSIAAGSTDTKSPGFRGVFGFVCYIQ